MGKEIDLLSNYPRGNRNIESRAETKTEAVRSIARKFGKEFFDGDRKYGYGGFNYHPRFWERVIPDFIKEYSLNDNSSFLDVGCAKGFMIYDFINALPKIKPAGIDISKYAISHCLPEVKQFIKVANAKELPFKDNTFDLVISINTIHNLPLDELILSLKEIERVSSGNSFITVDAYRDDDEKKKMLDWNLTAQTILSVDEWVSLFKDVGYTGDYYWFIP